jgi:hypothetical protein
MELSKEVIHLLKKNAQDETRPECVEDGEYFIPYDWFGGNMDDAYNGGVEDGAIHLSRTILDDLGIEYK